jgi:hypothetical protein
MNWNPNDAHGPYAETPTKPKDSILLKLLLGGCGCLILVGILFAVFAGKFFVSFTGPARNVKAHIESLNEGDVEQAYKYFSTEYRKSNSFATFKSEVDPFSDAFPLAEYSLKHIEVANDKATVEGIFTGKNGIIIPVRYLLVLEKKEWKINDYVWESPGKQQLI